MIRTTRTGTFALLAALAGLTWLAACSEETDGGGTGTGTGTGTTTGTGTGTGTGTASQGGAGGTGGAEAGHGGTGGAAAGNGGTGGAAQGGAGPCVACLTAYNSGDAEGLCTEGSPSSADLYDALWQCGCASMAECAQTCSYATCGNQPMGLACETCLSQSCLTELTECKADS